MCEICNGATLHEVLDRIDDDIRRRGWAIQGVEGSRHGGGDRPWAYSIGLIERYGHPELVVIDLAVGACLGLVDELAARVATGERFAPGDDVPIHGDASVGFVPVHAAHIERGLLNMWMNRYTGLGEASPPLEALQVVVPLTCCEGHRLRQSALSHPALITPPGRSNRAMRRAAARWSHRG